MLNSSLRSRQSKVLGSVSSPAPRAQMARFGFRIRTRGGVLIDNLSIPGASAEEAERKLRQIYMGCSVLPRLVPAPQIGPGAARRVG